MTTLTDTTDLGGDLTDLADGRTDVVYLRGRQLAQLDEVVSPPRETHEPHGVADTVVDAPADVEDSHEPAHVEELDDRAEPAEPAERLPEPVAPLRALNLPTRVEVRLDAPAIRRPDEDQSADDRSGDDQAAFVPVQRRAEEIRPAPELVPDLVHAETWAEVPVEIEAEDLSVHGPDELGLEERPEPVIGPRIAHAREMLGMSVDELSQRTRIRPTSSRRSRSTTSARAAATSTPAATSLRSLACSGWRSNP
jgi:hypothetical protein